MYNSMYQAIQMALQSVDGLEEVQWYNNQFEGLIGAVPVVYVEFDPLLINKATKMVSQTEIGIHLHVVTEVDGAQAGFISDQLVEEHFALVDEVLECTEGYTLPFDGGSARPLQLVGWTPQYKYNGWLVTTLDLKTKG